MLTMDAVGRGRRRFAQLVHRQLPLSEFFAAANDTLHSLVDFEVSCWLSYDPATLLPTGHFAPEVGSDHLKEIARNEYLEDDVNKFTQLLRGRHVATLRTATDGDPGRSVRYATFLTSLGYGAGDELRALFVDGDLPWGGVVLHRREGAFTGWEVDLLASLGPLLAEGIRRSIVAGSLGSVDEGGAPGLVVLSQSNDIEAVTAPARAWLAEIIDVSPEPGRLPLALVGLADLARRAAAGDVPDLARSRIPLRTGGWLVAHGCVLEGGAPGRVAVTLTPARQPQIAEIIVDSYRLSPREREITRLVLTGLATYEIARSLAIAPYTVQDHLKSIFAKVGVRSRRELVAQVFFRHYAPQLTEGAAIGWDGWFAGS